MATIISNILSKDDIEYLIQLPEVQESKSKTNTQSVVYFNVTLTETIKIVCLYILDILD